MTTLYKSHTGREVQHLSSSSIDAYRFCKRKFKLSRIDGWKQKDRKASLEFGKAIESAIQFWFENEQKKDAAVDEFKRIWIKFAEVPLTYTDQEGSHQDLYKMGSEMMRLFEIVGPELPIKNPKWQIEYSKELWPSSNYAGLAFNGRVDCLSTLADGTRIIVDIKTAKSALDVSPNMLAMDGQLRKYAWISGIKDVGFLNFIKARPDDFKKGTNITVLEEEAKTFVVYKYDSESGTILASEKEDVQKMDEAMETIKGKGATEAKATLLQKFVDGGWLIPLTRDQVTKTRIQYLQARISDEDLPEIGQSIGSDVLRVLQSNTESFWPKEGGVRFPDQKCVWCEFRGICTKNQALIDELLIPPQVKQEEEYDWLGDEEAA